MILPRTRGSIRKVRFSRWPNAPITVSISASLKFRLIWSGEASRLAAAGSPAMPAPAACARTADGTASKVSGAIIDTIDDHSARNISVVRARSRRLPRTAPRICTANRDALPTIMLQS